MEETVVLVFHLDVVEGERGGGLVPLCRTAAEGDGGVSVVHLSAKPHCHFRLLRLHPLRQCKHSDEECGYRGVDVSE